MRTLSPSCYMNITLMTPTASLDAVQLDALSCMTKHEDSATNKTNSIGNMVMPTLCCLLMSLLLYTNSLTPLLTSFYLIVYFPFSYPVPEPKWIFGKIQRFKCSLQLPVLWTGNSLFFHFMPSLHVLPCTTSLQAKIVLLLATTYHDLWATKLYVPYDTM